MTGKRRSPLPRRPATVTGLAPNSPLSVQLCAEDGYRCTWLGEFSADDDGTFEGDVRLWRNFGTWPEPGSSSSANVDCAVEACTLLFQADASGREVPGSPVSFDPERGARVPPTVQLAHPGPYAHGNAIELLVDGMAPGTRLDLQVCSTGGAHPGLCVGYFGGQYEGGGSFSARVHIDDQGGSDPCRTGCVLYVATYSDGQGGPADGPPPLLPEPVAFELVT